MNEKQIMAWIAVGSELFRLGSDAVRAVRDSLAAQGVPAETLAALDAEYTQRIEQAKKDAAGE